MPAPPPGSGQPLQRPLAHLPQPQQSGLLLAQRLQLGDLGAAPLPDSSAFRIIGKAGLPGSRPQRVAAAETGLGLQHMGGSQPHQLLLIAGQITQAGGCRTAAAAPGAAPATRRQSRWCTSQRIVRHCRSPSAARSSTRPNCGWTASTVHSAPSRRRPDPADRSSSSARPVTGRLPSTQPSDRPAGGSDRHRACGARAGAAHGHGQPPAATSPPPDPRTGTLPPAPRPGAGPEDQAVLKITALGRQSVQHTMHMGSPAGHDGVAPPRRQRRLAGGSETHRVLVFDQPGRANVEQPPGAVTEDRQEIRGVLAVASHRVETQPERLRQHLRHIADEIERQQQPLLLQRLEPVQATRGNQELQPRTMPLPRPPGKPPNRFRPRHRHRIQITSRAHDLAAGKPPRRSPAPRPIRPQRQQLPRQPADLVGCGSSGVMQCEEF